MFVLSGKLLAYSSQIWDQFCAPAKRGRDPASPLAAGWWLQEAVALWATAELFAISATVSWLLWRHASGGGLWGISRIYSKLLVYIVSCFSVKKSRPNLRSHLSSRPKWSFIGSPSLPPAPPCPNSDGMFLSAGQLHWPTFSSRPGTSPFNPRLPHMDPGFSPELFLFISAAACKEVKAFLNLKETKSFGWKELDYLGLFVALSTPNVFILLT